MLMLINGSQVLLALRENTGYADGLWNLPSGKLEDGEDVPPRQVLRRPRLGQPCLVALRLRQDQGLAKRSPSPRAPA